MRRPLFRFGIPMNIGQMVEKLHAAHKRIAQLRRERKPVKEAIAAAKRLDALVYQAYAPYFVGGRTPTGIWATIKPQRAGGYRIKVKTTIKHIKQHKNT